MSYTLRISSIDHVPTMGSSRLVGDEDGNVGCCTNFPCCSARHRTLYIYAALIWLIGTVICLVKGVEYLHHARIHDASNNATLAAILSGVIGGIVLGNTLFFNFATKNINRIEMLQDPKWHHAYRWEFYVFLVSINVLMVCLEKYVINDNDSTAYCVLSALDLSVGTALGYTLYVYILSWKFFGLRNNFFRKTGGLQEGEAGTSFFDSEPILNALLIPDDDKIAANA
jgi:hypothetical protein